MFWRNDSSEGYNQLLGCDIAAVQRLLSQDILLCCNFLCHSRQLLSIGHKWINYDAAANRSFSSAEWIQQCGTTLSNIPGMKTCVSAESIESLQHGMQLPTRIRLRRCILQRLIPLWSLSRECCYHIQTTIKWSRGSWVTLGYQI